MTAPAAPALTREELKHFDLLADAVADGFMAHMIRRLIAHARAADEALGSIESILPAMANCAGCALGAGVAYRVARAARLATTPEKKSSHA